MLIVQVQIKVLPDKTAEFIEATLENVRNSVKEPGIARFDFLQDESNPNQFLLIEVYRNVEATVLHKQTAHYLQWRDAVSAMMAEPRTSAKFRNLFPDDQGW